MYFQDNLNLESFTVSLKKQGLKLFNFIYSIESFYAFLLHKCNMENKLNFPRLLYLPLRLDRFVELIFRYFLEIFDYINAGIFTKQDEQNFQNHQISARLIVHLKFVLFLSICSKSF